MPVNIFPIINKAGELIDGDLFIVLFRLKEEIKRFQIFQGAIDVIEVNLVLKDDFMVQDANKTFGLADSDCFFYKGVWLYNLLAIQTF